MCSELLYSLGILKEDSLLSKHLYLPTILNPTQKITNNHDNQVSVKKCLEMARQLNLSEHTKLIEYTHLTYKALRTSSLEQILNYFMPSLLIRFTFLQIIDEIFNFLIFLVSYMTSHRLMVLKTQNFYHTHPVMVNGTGLETMAISARRSIDGIPILSTFCQNSNVFTRAI